jgi:hypothetical protein
MHTLRVTTTGNTSKSDIYEAPALMLHGTVADLTQAALPGPIHDAGFFAGAVQLGITLSL